MTYAHADTSLVKLLRRIDAASKTLDVCVFTITCNEIADAVVRAHERGVKVRVISDDEQANSTGSDLRAIADAGIPVRTDAASTHMHHKFAIVDGATLINGSFNWTGRRCSVTRRTSSSRATPSWRACSPSSTRWGKFQR